MNDLITRRKVLGCLMAGAIAPLVSACGGGGSGTSGAVDNAEVNAQKASTGSTTAFAVTSPAQNASATSTFTVSGTSGAQWVNVAIYSGSTKLSSDVTPASGKWSGSVNMGTLTGAQTLTLMAFSVAAGKSGGTSASTSLNVTIGTAAVTPPATTSAIPFYGVGSHYGQGGIATTNYPGQVADIEYMNAKGVRQDIYDIPTAQALAALIPTFAPIVIQPMFGAIPNSGASETSNYNTFFTYGVGMANAFAGKVPLVEMMNEPDNQYFPNGGASGDGNTITSWAASNSYWPAFRGACRGFVDGFRSIDTTKKTLISSPSISWLHHGLLDGLWLGTAPDGTSGHPTCHWDISNFHWYLDDGNIEAAGGSSINVPLHYKNTYGGMPIILTEVGVQLQQTESVIDNYFTTFFTWCATTGASTYGIEQIVVYELYNYEANSGFYMGLFTTIGTKNAARAATYKAVIAANPK